MQRTAVSSSNIVSIGYDASTRTLEVEFHAGTIYQYFGVPAQVHAALMSAASKGSYFDAYIKKGGYRYSQVR